VIVGETVKSDLLARLKPSRTAAGVLEAINPLPRKVTVRYTKPSVRVHGSLLTIRCQCKK